MKDGDSLKIAAAVFFVMCVRRPYYAAGPLSLLESVRERKIRFGESAGPAEI